MTLMKSPKQWEHNSLWGHHDHNTPDKDRSIDRFAQAQTDSYSKATRAEAESKTF
jgi:hypothetical protein